MNRARVNTWLAHFVREKAWPLGVLLFVLVFVVYQPVWHAGFIWDDDSHLTANPCIVGPLGFRAIWTSVEAVYYPLVLTTFWLEHALWGLDPLPYHLVNVAMHGMCAVLLWRVLNRLKIPGSWLGAALWALHPVMVESVAWITELKNTQSGLFYLLAILQFLKWRGRQSNSTYYALALVCGALALLSKTSTVMLPVVLGLCWWWMDGRWRWGNSFWLMPFAVISMVGSVWTIWEQRYHSGALGPEWSGGIWERFAISGKAVWFYLGKLVWPHPLIFIYPRWSIDAANSLEYLPALAAGCGIFVLWRGRNGRLRPFFFAAAYYIVSLLPVLGFFNVYFFRYSFVGDHFQYLASIGPLALAGAGIRRTDELKSTLIGPGSLCGVILVILGTLTWRQCAIYDNIETLFQETVERNPACWMAQNALGVLSVQQGRLDDAIAHFQRAIELKPDYLKAIQNLAGVLERKGRLAEAAVQYERAIEIKPDAPEDFGNLGVVLGREGRHDGAIAEFQKAIEIKPDEAEAYYNLGYTFEQTARYEDAISQYEKAIQLKPDYVQALNNLASILATSRFSGRNNSGRAIDLALRANKLSGGDAAILDTLAAAYADAGRFSEAIETQKMAIERAGIKGNSSLADVLQKHLTLYQAGQPLRDAR